MWNDPLSQLALMLMYIILRMMFKALDRGVGTILSAIEESGKADNTLVIFTSDNGGPGYNMQPAINAPFRGWKATFFEGGLRVPLFLKWPKRYLQQNSEHFLLAKAFTALYPACDIMSLFESGHCITTSFALSTCLAHCIVCHSLPSFLRLLVGKLSQLLG